MIDPADVAAAAVRALTTDKLLGQRPVLTGPAALTHAELVGVIGEVLGRPLRYEGMPDAVIREMMVGRGSGPDFVDSLLARYAAGMGRLPVVTDDVEKITGRRARTFAEWVTDNKSAFGG